MNINKYQAQLGVLVASTFALATSAHAALPTDVTNLFDDLEANVTELSGYAWTIVAAVLGVSILIGLVKKFAKKGAS